MVSAKAFSNLRQDFRRWLRLDKEKTNEYIFESGELMQNPTSQRELEIVPIQENLPKLQDSEQPLEPGLLDISGPDNEDGPAAYQSQEEDTSIAAEIYSEPNMCTNIYIYDHLIFGIGYPYTVPEIIDSIFDMIPWPIWEPPCLRDELESDGNAYVDNPPRPLPFFLKSCGQKLFDGFVEVQPGSFQHLKTRLRELSGGRGTSNKMQGGIFSQLLYSIFISIKQALEKSLSLKPNTNTSLPLHSLHSTLQQQHSNNQEVLHLLLCIDKGEYWTRLYQIRLENIDKDHNLFLFLRNQYFKNRKLGSWITLRSIKTLSLIRIGLD